MRDIEISEYMVDVDSYINELVVGLKLAHDFARANNQCARERMKRYYYSQKKVSERPFSLGERVYMRLPPEKATSKHPKLVNEWSRPFRIIDCSQNSALITPVNGSAEPVREQFDLLQRVPKSVDNEPVDTVRKRGKGGRPKKREATQSKITCCRVDVGPPQGDLRHLFHPCTCSIFHTKAQAAPPSLCCTFGCCTFEASEQYVPVGYVASIVLDPFWGDRRRVGTIEQGFKTSDRFRPRTCHCCPQIEFLRLRNGPEGRSWQTNRAPASVPRASMIPDRIQLRTGHRASRSGAAKLR